MKAFSLTGALVLLLLVARPGQAQQTAVPEAATAPPEAVVAQVNESLLGAMQEAEALAFQGRYDRLDPGSVDFGANSEFLSTSSYKPTRHSLMLDYSPSEFSRLRLQYSKDKSMEGLSENQWFVQYIHSLGAHGAHSF